MPIHVTNMFHLIFSLIISVILIIVIGRAQQGITILKCTVYFCVL